ncbi:threonine aldolase family protein [Phenylobacterium montanum]|uniref:Low specificity L-threonine aldolase n=1 Tax=Phenylobacterium montanum TaxID=2823693 RepID=A0A975ITS6_9CAUL|nr:beta-eliminating lyase-related protein [Caulobacter sp. S6]QUD87182.1 low specificity L-threonine aldolase [Caulobacter sp. S6]
MLRQDFASDNTHGAAPEALDALVAANAGAVDSYGEDGYCARAADLIRGLLDADAEVRFVASGTAANAISLAALCRPFERVLAHAEAHVAVAETGAPNAFGHGLTIRGLPGASARIDSEALKAVLAEPEHAHAQPPAALSLTQATEYGAVYGLDHLRRLTAAAKAKGLGVHMDGARLANAIAAGFDPKAIPGLGVDLLVVGGTKAGMTPTEALVIFDKALARRFDARLKNAGQLPSKSRFYAAPWIGMLESGAYQRHAAHANAMARKLAAECGLKALHPVESNGLFAELSPERHKRLTDAGWLAFRCDDGSVRFMCAWATTEAVVEELAAAIRATA